MATNHADVYAVAGAKGGIGKTTTSINLASAFAEQNFDTLVIECDLAMANVVDFLKLDMVADSDPTLHEVLSGEVDTSTAIYEAPGGFDIIPSGVTLEGYVKSDPRKLHDVVEGLSKSYDIILLDVGAGLSFESVLPMKIADKTILVSSPRVASVRDIRKTKRLAELAGSKVVGIVFVKSGTGKAPPPDRIAVFLDVNLLGHVPDDDHVPAAQDSGQPVLLKFPDSSASRAYREITAKLISANTIDEAATVTDSADLSDQPGNPGNGQTAIDESALEGSENVD